LQVADLLVTKFLANMLARRVVRSAELLLAVAPCIFQISPATHPSNISLAT